MKNYFLSLIIAGHCINSWALNYELPITHNTSSFYYVPQSKLEKQEKGFLSSASYSANGSYLESWSMFYGCRRCELQNVVLVNKKTKEKKTLFDADKTITTFFITSDTDVKKKLPTLLFMILKTNEREKNFEFYIANLDGTKLTRVSPAGHTVVSYDFDVLNQKLFLLLRMVPTKEDELNPSRPFIVDLQKIATAVPLFED